MNGRNVFNFHLVDPYGLVENLNKTILNKESPVVLTEFGEIESIFLNLTRCQRRLIHGRNPELIGAFGLIRGLNEKTHLVAELEIESGELLPGRPKEDDSGVYFSAKFSLYTGLIRAGVIVPPLIAEVYAMKYNKRAYAHVQRKTFLRDGMNSPVSGEDAIRVIPTEWFLKKRQMFDYVNGRC